MTEAEAGAQRPFRIRVVQAGTSDTQEALARRMAVRDAALRRFQVLNGLRAGEALQPGLGYKIIAE
jgi:predicted Zn-dependent protease